MSVEVGVSLGAACMAKHTARNGCATKGEGKRTGPKTRPYRKQKTKMAA